MIFSVYPTPPQKIAFWQNTRVFMTKREKTLFYCEKNVDFSEISLILVIQRPESRFEGCFFAKKSLSRNLFICAFLRVLGWGGGENRARL